MLLAMSRQVDGQHAEGMDGWREGGLPTADTMPTP